MTKKEFSDIELDKVSGGNKEDQTIERLDPNEAFNGKSFNKRPSGANNAPGWRFRAEGNTDGQYFKIIEETQDN